MDLFSYPNIKPACLPSFSYSGRQAVKLLVNLFHVFYYIYYLGGAVVSGWGTLFSGGYSVSHLRDVDVNVFANGDCGSMNSEMDETMICAGYMAGGKVNYMQNQGTEIF